MTMTPWERAAYGEGGREREEAGKNLPTAGDWFELRGDVGNAVSKIRSISARMTKDTEEAYPWIVQLLQDSLRRLEPVLANLNKVDIRTLPFYKR